MELPLKVAPSVVVVEPAKLSFLVLWLHYQEGRLSVQCPSGKLETCEVNTSQSRDSDTGFAV